VSEMLEKVARAICEADERNGGAPYEHRITLGKHAKEALFDEARAAIEALRVPTDRMLIAGTPWYHDNWRKGHVREDTALEAMWQAMLDAALDEPPA
jgi:hypothetical protein